MMARTSRALTLALALGVAPALVACGNDNDMDADDIDAQPTQEVTQSDVEITEVDLGNAIGADKRVLNDDDNDEFRPSDTIYAVVTTEGAAAGATLMARWTYEDGQPVDESTQSITPSGPAVTEFHISKPDGLPVGTYHVEIFLNGESKEKKDFEVK
jgi:hypothetical protein